MRRRVSRSASCGRSSAPAQARRLDALPDVLFVRHVAALLGCSPSTVTRRVVDGTFPVPPLPSVDRKLRWSRAQFRSWLETGDPYAQARPRRSREVRA